MSSLVPQLRQRFRQGSVWRQNLVYRDEDDDINKMTDLCFERGEITIADWELEKGLNQPLIEPNDETLPLEVTTEHIANQYRDDITDDIDWNLVRDVLHKGRYADEYDTKIKSGNAVGCIRRFLFEASKNDAVLINSSRGTAVAIFDGPAVYDPEQPQTDIDRNHVFRRSVKFMHDEGGEIITFESSELPQPLKPNQLTMTSVNRDDLQIVLRQAEALTTLADTLALTEE